LVSYAALWAAMASKMQSVLDVWMDYDMANNPFARPWSNPIRLEQS
jgi:hypothetical protein